MTRAPVYVTRPSIPPLADVLPLLEEIWDTRMLTNFGPLLRRFESALADHLGVDHVALVANATLGTVLAMQQAGITSGEVITTPFSFVATAHAIRIAGAEPVFADIDPVTLNLDPAQVEKMITPQTRAILPVHTFGIPCDVDGLADVANRHGLKLIYDAAHAFGVSRDGQSILRHGDMSVLSFHATKVFNTFEGGAVIVPNHETKCAIDRLANFGFADAQTVEAIGTNAKMHELSAAVGLAQLCGIDAVLAERAKVAQRYHDALKDVPDLYCVSPTGLEGHNHYAFPILLRAGYQMDRDTLLARLEAENIFARRYFYPLISDLDPYNTLPSAAPEGLPVAHAVADQVLCLPLFADLDPATQDRIIDLVKGQ
ncbi:DegT/DnrJ/EryC1/StrS family aminotransferase [Cognatiyoonia sp. IB215182]|uniref:DegT/DnrJ/EryC1/StrS family aminotransferase n=1 Tax=Cognatiyoonia sp. IB215182 TaxID=3097353 RepID=UPI002A16FB44|nr:DegT/DnrJ/EryC1/StrS family aminotransferase [Cognatiyoonia sp. IB215182]MDX8353078.1 DegT/DnrJ/EryC1/StrS family aminotransferase [Cognatiyoonia sp. IB215182]